MHRRSAPPASRSALLLPLLLALTAALPATSAHAGARSYCCNNDQGQQFCGDILPHECRGRAYRELGPRGNTLRLIEAPQTAEQKAQRAAEQERKKAAERAAMEERRRNQALLNTYTNEKDIEFMRDRAIADVEASSKEIQNKFNDAQKRKKKLDGEIEFYKKKGIPPELKEQIKANEIELKAQQAALDAKKLEVEQVRLKFEEDRQRFRELTQGKQQAAPAPAAPPPPATTPAPAPATPAKRG